VTDSDVVENSISYDLRVCHIIRITAVIERGFEDDELDIANSISGDPAVLFKYPVNAIKTVPLR